MTIDYTSKERWRFCMTGAYQNAVADLFRYSLEWRHNQLAGKLRDIDVPNKM